MDCYRLIVIMMIHPATKVKSLLPDQRVKDWALMTSPKPLAGIIATYLVVIKLVLPYYMRGRRPYELRSLIKWYNVVQIVANSVVTWGVRL